MGIVGLAAIAAPNILTRDAPSPERIPDSSAPHIEIIEQFDDSQIMSVGASQFETESATAPLPRKVASLLQPTIDDVNSLLHPKEAIRDLHLYRFSTDGQVVDRPVYYNAHPIDNGIRYDLIPDHVYAAKDLQHTTFHEGMHVFLGQENADGDNLLSGGLVVKAMRYMYSRQPENVEHGSYDAQAPGSTINLDKTGLLPIFDESSYNINPGGHPYSTPNEFAASALTVMRYSPESVIATLETLHPEDRRVIAQFVGDVMNRARTMAADETVFDRLFDQRLVTYAADARTR